MEEICVLGVAKELDVFVPYSTFLEVIVIDFFLYILLDRGVDGESMDSLWEGCFGWIVSVPLVYHSSMYLASMDKSIHSSFSIASTPNIESIASFSFSLSCPYICTIKLKTKKCNSSK